jgi:hypothetical protein
MVIRIICLDGERKQNPTDRNLLEISQDDLVDEIFSLSGGKGLKKWLNLLGSISMKSTHVFSVFFTRMSGKIVIGKKAYDLWQKRGRFRDKTII